MSARARTTRIATIAALAIASAGAVGGAVALTSDGSGEIGASVAGAKPAGVVVSARETGSVKDAGPRVVLGGETLEIAPVSVPEGGYFVHTRFDEDGQTWIMYVPVSGEGDVVEAFQDREEMVGVRTSGSAEGLFAQVGMADGWWNEVDPKTGSLKRLVRWNTGFTGDASDVTPPAHELATAAVGSLLHTATSADERAALLTVLGRMPGAKTSPTTVLGREGVALSWRAGDALREEIVVARDGGEVIGTRTHHDGEPGPIQFHYQAGSARVDFDTMKLRETMRATGDCLTAGGTQTCGRFDLDQ